MVETETLADVAKRLGLTVKSEFVPFSQSRNAKKGATINERSLNWRVTLEHNGRAVVTTDYSAGIAHCPSYKRLRVGSMGRMTVEQAEAIQFETEQGKQRGLVSGTSKIEPDALDVISSLALDASVLDHPTFESWAEDYGYETDSRKAEAIYRACLEIALQMRVALGDKALEELQQAASEY